MNKSAIQFALYLHQYPEAGLQQWQMMRTLPQGMSEMLQIAASGQKRTEFADSLGIDEKSLQTALVKFLQLVISEHQKSPYRGLAARDNVSLDICTKHKKLLQNIFHPDKFHNEKSHQLIQQIQQSYDMVLGTNSADDSTANAMHFTAKPQENESVMDFQVNHAPRPSSAYKRHAAKKQTNYLLVAGIAGLALASLLVVLIVPSNPQEMVRQAVIADPQPTAPEKKLILAGSTSTSDQSSRSLSGQYQRTSASDNSRIQVLLNEFERGLEGELINELLRTKNPSQSSKQIMDLFATADQKKVFLHGFSWNLTEQGFYGEGEFLVRFQFSENNQWVTRKGKSSITLSDNDSKLLIEQFHFEDNLH